jgi:hypothetical protein
LLDRGRDARRARAAARLAGGLAVDPGVVKALPVLPRAIAFRCGRF